MGEKWSEIEPKVKGVIGRTFYKNQKEIKKGSDGSQIAKFVEKRDNIAWYERV